MARVAAEGRWLASRARLADAWIAIVLLAAGISDAATAAQPKLTVAGPAELVAAAETMTCRTANPRAIDVTDMPPSAYRRDDGTVILVAGNRANWYFEGPSLDQVRRTGCATLLAPANDPDPSRYRAHEWVFALHSKDGRSVLGFVHNEYHGHEHGHRPCNVTNRQDYECWYSSVTLVTSENAGRTFSRPSAPSNVLLSLPWPFEPGRKRAGVGGPKVVANPTDGKLYVLATSGDRSRGIKGGQCLVRGSGTRTDDWEIWNSQGFVRYDSNPYGCNGACTRRLGDCMQVMGGNVFSVRYIPAFKAFVALHLEPNTIVYRLSPVLIRWSEPEVLLETTLIAHRRSGDPAPDWYPSLLDPTSSSRNFDTLEKRPYLYFVRFRLDGDRVVNGRRDVMRIPLRIE